MNKAIPNDGWTSELLVRLSSQDNNICVLEIKGVSVYWRSVGGDRWSSLKRAVLSWFLATSQVRCGAVPAHWTPDWQEAASVPHAGGRGYDADRACGWGSEICSNGECCLFVPLCCCSLNFLRCQDFWSICWLHCRSCGSREKRSDLGRMMMTQKKLLGSGIGWQEGKRRRGKLSSLVFGQTFMFFSLWPHELSENSLLSHL